MSENIFYHAIVVGAGPAGSVTAAFLGKKGRKVLLLDRAKWPRDKTCGDAISGKSVGMLEELGMINAVEKAEHADVCGVVFSSPEGTVVKIAMERGGQEIGKGYVCRRKVYDNLLFENAKKHADVIEEAEVTGLVLENGKVAGVKARTGQGEQEFRSKVVIGADGVSSFVARHVRGAEVDPKHTCIAYRAYYSGVKGMEGKIEIHFVDSIMPGYFWIFPLENGLANVGLGMTMADVKEKDIGLAKAMDKIIKENSLFKDRFSEAKPVSPIRAWTIPLGSKKRKLVSDNVLLVGDAAGLVDPFSGEGIGNAMTSAKIAANAVHEALEANDTSESFLERYEKRLWDEIWGELSASNTMQKLGRNKWLLNFVINKAATSEKAREAIAGTLMSKEATQAYSSPLFYLRLLLS